MGYLVAAPGAYWFAKNKTEGCSSWADPLVDDHVGTDILALCWYFHFYRRVIEVVFVNRYHGKGIPNERDSISEFVIYAIWGYINGLTGKCITSDEETGKIINLDSVLTTANFGLVLFGLGQIGNYLCHSHLRSLRPDPDDTKWVIPSKFPFSILIAPHYTFELLTWFGYMLAAGFAPPSLIILVLSFGGLSYLASNRKQKYIDLMKKDEGDVTEVSNPKDRYLLIPFVF